MHILNKIKNLGNLQDFDSRSIINTAAIGIASGAKTNILASLDNFKLIVTNDSITATKLKEDLIKYDKDPVILPSKEEVLLYNKAFSREETYQRLSALFSILKEKTDIAIVTVEALCRIFPDRNKFNKACITIEQNGNYNLNKIVKNLVFSGYKRENVVEGKGQFALRGDILDIYAVNCENPYRIDFFDTTAEKIKYFDINSGKSFEETIKAEIAPATDIFIYEEEIKEIISKIEKSYKNLKLNDEYKQRANDICKDVINRIQNGDREYSLNYIMPFIKGENDLSQYLPKNSIIIFDDYKLLDDKLTLIYKEHQTRYAQLLSFGEVLPESLYQYANKEKLFNQFDNYSKFTINSLNNDTFYQAKNLKFNTTKIPKYALNFTELKTDISNWLYSGYNVYICCKNQEGIKELEDNLYSLGQSISTDINAKNQPVALPLSIKEGFISHKNKFVLIGYLDIFIKNRSKKLKRKKKDVFLSPEIGDYIVHTIHGVGICKGIKNLKTGNNAKDYIVLEYQGGDTLYVPCDQMELIAKYSGTDTLPKLNKLGGKEFEKTKQKVKNYLKEMAFDLKKLYAERENRKGYAFSVDSPLQKEFEDAFEFEETYDQLKSVKEIKKDMESPFVMDRLLCGDVGYGKTEVSLRAAFKAVIDAKQVAILSPTTILSQQHYNLCKKRFYGLGVRIEVLNRFKSKKEQQDILTKLIEGKIDILIGTHRLLSKDVKFKDLGLLIVDEEQRFGVEDKEKIKNINRAVDVLTLTATPIPRTLHMSLSGIRDISVLDTPPNERLPVQTYVLEFSEGLLSDAINRELARGGQVFILYNRVEGIESFTYSVKQTAPKAKVVSAHGQMNKDSLEKAIEKFYKGEIDVLVCTTIIENGIDIPNVNTLIVYEADRLGLSQLYQLRGRVGRGNRLAHVYFTYIPQKVLTENAYKRLKAIMEYTEFGSGFKIAMRDLEIRGAGSVLGKAQHGHIQNVGYDMYLKLLKQSLQAEEISEEEISVDITVDAYIPEKYIEDNGQRMKVYQKISSMEISEKQDLLEEILDIYGEIPQSVKNLIDIRLVKLLAQKSGAEAVILKPKTAKILFKDMNVIKKDSFLDATEKFSSYCTLKFTEKPEIEFSKRYNSIKMLNIMIDFLTEITKKEQKNL